MPTKVHLRVMRSIQGGEEEVRQTARSYWICMCTITKSSMMLCGDHTMHGFDEIDGLRLPSMEE